MHAGPNHLAQTHRHSPTRSPCRKYGLPTCTLALIASLRHTATAHMHAGPNRLGAAPCRCSRVSALRLARSPTARCPFRRCPSLRRFTALSLPFPLPFLGNFAAFLGLFPRPFTAFPLPLPALCTAFSTAFPLTFHCLTRHTRQSTAFELPVPDHCPSPGLSTAVPRHSSTFSVPSLRLCTAFTRLCTALSLDLCTAFHTAVTFTPCRCHGLQVSDERHCVNSCSVRGQKRPPKNALQNTPSQKRPPAAHLQNPS